MFKKINVKIAKIKDKKLCIPELYEELKNEQQAKMYKVVLPYFLSNRHKLKRELYTIKKVMRERNISLDSIIEAYDKTEKMKSLFKHNKDKTYN